MVVAVLEFELFARQSQSLKDKRRIVLSLKDRLRAHFNVSVAEVDFQDDKKRATIGIAMVGSDPTYVQGALDEIKKALLVFPDAQVGRIDTEFLM